MISSMAAAALRRSLSEWSMGRRNWLMSNMSGAGEIVRPRHVRNPELQPQKKSGNPQVETAASKSNQRMLLLFLLREDQAGHDFQRRDLALLGRLGKASAGLIGVSTSEVLAQEQR